VVSDVSFIISWISFRVHGGRFGAMGTVGEQVILKCRYTREEWLPGGPDVG
jgi:hypothetical protein